LHVISAREGVQSIHLRLDRLFGNLATPPDDTDLNALRGRPRAIAFQKIANRRER
jgi:hypothetical protein